MFYKNKIKEAEYRKQIKILEITKENQERIIKAQDEAIKALLEINRLLRKNRK